MTILIIGNLSFQKEKSMIRFLLSNSNPLKKDFSIISKSLNKKKEYHLNSNFYLRTYHNLGSDDLFFKKDRSDFLIIDGLIFQSRYQIKTKGVIDHLFNSIKKYGFEKVIKKIDGDFSIVFFSEQEQKIFFGRDNFGVKPLYFLCNQNTFALASQPSLIINSGLCNNRVNNEYLLRYAGLHYRFIDINPFDSPYENIDQVPASYYFEYDLKSSKIKKNKYWQLENILPTSYTKVNDLSSQYLEVLKNAVSKRINTKNKKIFSISGGMDSSTVLCIAEKLLKSKIESFSVTYKDKVYDESKEIKEITDEKTSLWHNFQIDNFLDIEKMVSKIVEINDEPIATSTWLSHFLALDNLGQYGYEIVYGGLGGDEFNAGEYEYFTYFFADTFLNNKLNLKNEINCWEQNHNHKIFKKSYDIAIENLKKNVDLNHKGKCNVDLERALRYFGCIETKNFKNYELNKDLYCPFQSYLNNRTFHDLFYETLPCCLRAQDRHGSYFGMDIINPFLDKDLAEFMFSVPFNLKIKNGVTKHLLRLATKNILPESTRSRIKKTGWNAPAHLWFSGKNLEFIEDEVNSKRFKGLGIYNIENVKKILSEHKKIVEDKLIMENHMMFIWQLCNIIVWSKKVSIKL